MLKLDIPTNMDYLREQYNLDRRLNVLDIWQRESAQTLAEALGTKTPFSNAFFIDNAPQLLADGELRSLPPEQQQQIHSKIYQNASNGVGYLYGTHRIDRRPEISPTTPNVLVEAHQLLNSEVMMNFIRELTGYDDIKYASAQGTRYIPGNFLTRHNDIVEAEGRRVAFVMGFTPQWHPDWGGNLQFYQDNGLAKNAWMPMFNNMALFDVKHAHAVTFVAPFARAIRYSITGWFRANPPA
ncbi:MAG TPA: proline hydroxylase [Rheinheimera sp.]|nr:proline hydroxylase [Rheinheimera sp.]